MSGTPESTLADCVKVSSQYRAQLQSFYLVNWLRHFQLDKPSGKLNYAPPTQLSHGTLLDPQTESCWAWCGVSREYAFIVGAYGTSCECSSQHNAQSSVCIIGLHQAHARISRVGWSSETHDTNFKFLRDLTTL